MAGTDLHLYNLYTYSSLYCAYTYQLTAGLQRVISFPVAQHGSTSGQIEPSVTTNFCCTACHTFHGSRYRLNRNVPYAPNVLQHCLTVLVRPHVDLWNA